METIENIKVGDLVLTHKGRFRPVTQLIRKEYNDWDFSEDGRIRQSVRMRSLADAAEQKIVIVDMVAPMIEQRDIFDADMTVWVDTIKEGRYEDTNRAFTQPIDPTFRIVTQNSTKWAKVIVEHINNGIKSS